MKKIDILFWLLIVLIIIALIIFKYHYKLFIVESGSMQPNLKIGELIIVKKCETYQVGDIITFQKERSNSYITHRIMEIDESQNFITKGDFNNAIDENNVNQENIVGKMIFHSKLLGLIFYKYKMVVIIILIVNLIIVSLCKNK